jgi:hypothetical protein
LEQAKEEDTETVVKTETPSEPRRVSLRWVLDSEPIVENEALFPVKQEDDDEPSSKVVR